MPHTQGGAAGAGPALRRLSSAQRPGAVAGGIGGSGVDGAAGGAWPATGPAGVTQLLHYAESQREYFCADRFKGGRTAFGEWVSRYRTDDFEAPDWRQGKLRTVAAALCVCLNIGTEPPGMEFKPAPCASRICWIEPEALQPAVKSLELIGNTLVQQYSRWQPKAKYEQLLDPTSGAVKRTCQSLRRSSARERLLFHYSGHGVPRPTSSGELWVFDKGFTMYVPLSVYDLLTWLGGHTILVLDCNAAGAVTDAFNSFLRQKADETRMLALQDPEKAKHLPDYSESILLGACGPNQNLPFTPAYLPMDLFTSCLTTPLKVALQFFGAQSVFTAGAYSVGGPPPTSSSLRGPGGCPIAVPELLDRIPGKLHDRKTPLGELNWIYTAITDTIAWSILPRAVFQRLFRQDLLLASLLRNFILATRILGAHGCTTVCSPPLPNHSLIAKHPMWASWDLCCEQYTLSLDRASVLAASMAATAAVAEVVNGSSLAPAVHINFFSEHLLAFEVWLEVCTEKMGAPVQLPIVLQVLLSQVHRRRALILLARFLGKGSWAVRMALSVGIFPYVLRLLQSPDVPLREVLVFIWSKLLALDLTVQEDIIREKHETYFATHLVSGPTGAAASPAIERPRVMSAFVLSSLCDGPYVEGQAAVLRAGGLRCAGLHLASESANLRKWACLLLGKLWDGSEEARALAQQGGVPEKLCAVIADPVPEVRAAALYALGTFMAATPAQPLSTPASSSSSPAIQSAGPTGPPLVPPRDPRDRHAQELMLAKNFSQLVVDASPLVREELGIALALLVDAQRDEFMALAQERNFGGSGDDANNHSFNSVPASPASHGMSGPAVVVTWAGGPASGSIAMPSSNAALTSGAGSGYAGAGSFIPSSPSLGGLAVTPMLRAASSGSLSTPGTHRSISETSPPLASTPMSTGMASPTAGPVNLAISVAASNAVPPSVLSAKPVSPLSPLQLQQTTLALPTGNPAHSRSSSLSGTPSIASSMTTTPPTLSIRPSLTRASSLGSISNSLSPAELAYNQRSLIWRVVRTLSHDPHPSVSSIAIALRKNLMARAFMASASSSSSSSSFSQQQVSSQYMSVQSSPHLMSTMGALNTVPEQSLDETSLLDAPDSRASPVSGQSRGSEAGRNSVGLEPMALPSRGRSDGSAATVAAAATPSFDFVATRPRSRPVSEIEGAGSGPVASSAGPSNSILGSMAAGGGIQAAGVTTPASNRAPSPSVATLRTSMASPAASPRHQSQPTPNFSGSQSSRKLNQLLGTRLTFDEQLLASPSFSTPVLASAPIIPPSTIFARSAEYFLAPVGAISAGEMNAESAQQQQFQQLQQQGDKNLQPQPEDVLERLLTASWRAKRNADVLHTACLTPRDSYDVVAQGTFEQTACLATGYDAGVTALLFHPFEPMLMVSEKKLVSLWDTRDMERVNQWSNENTSSSRISCLHWMNEQQQSLLLVGSDDGVVRLWKNAHIRDSPPELVSAWLAVRSMPRGAGVGLILDWQQHRGHLLASGPVDSIRVWDVEREICVLDLPVDSDSYVSSICSSSTGQVVFAGAGDGVVRMFDLRADNTSIHTVSKHTSSVVNVRAQRWGPGLEGDLVSGSANGDIHLSDTRLLGGPLTRATASSVLVMPGFEKSVSLDAFAVHDHAPLFAAGSRKQVVRLANFKNPSAVGASSLSAGMGGLVGSPVSSSAALTSATSPSASSSVPSPSSNTVSTLKYHKGFMGHRIGPVTALAFHPHKLLLAVGAANPLVSLLAAFPASAP